MSSACRGVALAALVAAACHNSAENETAAAGAPVAVGIPVGPVPGPGKVDLPDNPLGMDDAVLQSGRKLFNQYNCSGCHGDHGGGGMGPSLRDEIWIYGSSDAQVFNSIAEGRAHGMPAWGVKLPDEHVWKLVSYIHSLRTPKEPQPPTPVPPELP